MKEQIKVLLKAIVKDGHFRDLILPLGKIADQNAAF